MFVFSVIIAIIAIFVCLHYSNEATKAIIEKRKLEREVVKLKAEIEKLKKAQVLISEERQEEKAHISETEENFVEHKQSEEELARIEKERRKIAEEKAKEEEEKRRVEAERRRIEEAERRRKEEANELEKRNTTILATGAVLIILAAIVFLSSTWSILSDIVKTLGLILFLGIFAGASKISKEKYHLEKASKTFFYLAMAYIPICFISLSVFELLGEYLSIHGDGIYIYFFASSAITAAVYYYFYYTRKDIALFYGSILAQAASMVLFVLIFSTNIRLIVAILLAYNIVLAILCSPKTYKMLEWIVYIASYIALFVSVLLLIENSWINVLVLVLLALNFLLLYLKFDEKGLAPYLFNIILYIIGFYVAFKLLDGLSNTMQLLTALVYCTFISVFESVVINDNHRYIELKSSITIVNLIAFAVLYVAAVLLKSEFIKPYMIALVGEVYLIRALTEYKGTSTADLISYAIPIVFLFIMIEIGSYIPLISFTLITLLLCMIGELFRNTKYNDLNVSFSVIGGVVWAISFVSLLVTPENHQLIDKVILLLIAIYYLCRTRKSLYKYLSYMAFGLLIFKDIELDYIENWMYVAPTLFVVIIAMLEIAKPNLEDAYSSVFISVISLISYIGLGKIGSDISIIIAFAFSVIIYFYFVVTKCENAFKLVPMLGLMAMIRILSEDLNMIVLWEAIYTILLVLVTVSTGKLSYEAICSGIMLVLFLGPDTNSKVIASAIYVIWSVIHLITATNDEKMKDVFTGLTIVSMTYFYYAILSEIGITDEYMSPLFIGIAVAIIVFMERIVKKYTDVGTYQIIEYIIYGVICISAFVNYQSEIDGMIFVLFLIIFAGLSYGESKNGKFKVSIVAILINAFALTRDFWFSLPWWIYLLFAGAGMIGFAMINESNSNKRNKSNNTDILNNNEKVNIGQSSNYTDKDE